MMTWNKRHGPTVKVAPRSGGVHGARCGVHSSYPFGMQLSQQVAGPRMQITCKTATRRSHPAAGRCATVRRTEWVVLFFFSSNTKLVKWTAAETGHVSDNAADTKRVGKRGGGTWRAAGRWPASWRAVGRRLRRPRAARRRLRLATGSAIRRPPS